MTQNPMNEEFNFGESKRRRDEGMANAKLNRSTMAWQHDAGRWFMLLPIGTTFVMDDVVRAVGLAAEGANKNNVVGAWINGLAKAKFIAKTGRVVKSERITRHAGEANEWMKLRG
jgi:hypothetical protein